MNSAVENQAESDAYFAAFSNAKQFLQSVSRALFTSTMKGTFHRDLVKNIKQKAASGQDNPSPLTSNSGPALAKRLSHTEVIPWKNCRSITI